MENPHDIANPPAVTPRKTQKVLLALFVVGLVIVAAFVLTQHWRRGTFGLGLCFFWLAGMRLTCDSSVIGLFSVRSKRFDVAYAAGLGSALVFLAASVDALGS
ncbi:membrane protein [Corynebacterium atypicum]|uniref:Membrane protein n=1 Tax=Corynebacterium atypicum TaxID=191610 RepID=A0ABM5QLR3_9CORY|nr:membrane protein [Corynebacterium atypicum]